MEQVIWYIDENIRDLRTFAEALRKAIHHEAEYSNIKVEALLAQPHLQDYAKLLNDPRTVCIFIDQKMRTTGETDYNGIDVALFLRTLDNKIPICILTANKEDDETIAELEGNEWSVEYVFEKAALQPVARPSKKNTEKKRELIQRLLRRLVGHQEVSEKTESRFLELLNKSLSEEMTNEELSELDLLETDRTRSILYEENLRLSTLRNAVEQLRQINEEVQQLEEQLIRQDDDEHKSTSS